LISLKNGRREASMEVGRIVIEDTAEALLADSKVRNAYPGGGR
jgi:ABC-type branched-subunit amino acid transport system ATPase component